MRHTFRVVAATAPDLPLRVLNLFAQQAIVIDAAQVSRDADVFRVEIVVAGLADHPAAIIAEKLRAMVLVTAVDYGRCPAPVLINS
jgi:acetolactate synthase regulatory subunit